VFSGIWFWGNKISSKAFDSGLESIQKRYFLSIDLAKVRLKLICRKAFND